MTIKIEFPADRTDIALAIGQALTQIGQGATAPVKVGADPVLAAPYGKEEQKEWEENLAAHSHTAHNGGQTGPTVEQEAEVDAAFEGKPGPSTAEHVVGGAPVAQGTAGVNTDEKGVAFNAEYCSKAAIPFYGSGKKKGQWKKRQGVDEGAYDEWYADELFGSKVEDTTPEEPVAGGHIAADTFGNTAAAAPLSPDVPQDAGQLMKWVSEQQAAGNVSQQQVTDAYTALKLPFDAVMNPAYDVVKNCAAIYEYLQAPF